METALELEKKINNLIKEFNAKNYESVIIQAKKIINSNSEISIIYNLLGASYSLVNNHLEAIIAYQNAYRLDAGNEEIFRNMGKSYSKLDEDKKAYECFKQANSIKPNNADTIFNMGLLDLKKKSFKIVLINLI